MRLGGDTADTVDTYEDGKRKIKPMDRSPPEPVSVEEGSYQTSHAIQSHVQSPSLRFR